MGFLILGVYCKHFGVVIEILKIKISAGSI